MTRRKFLTRSVSLATRETTRSRAQSRSESLAVALLLGTILCAAPRAGWSAEDKPSLALEGKLRNLAATGPVLRTDGKDYPLAARTTYLFHTLEDKRLSNREVRLEGAMRPDGHFEVSHIFTVRDRKVYKIRYFCEVCNIEALEPGDCVCCQQPTELQEIPLGEEKK